MKHFQSAALRDKRLTSKLQDPTFTGYPIQDPSSGLVGGGGLMKLQDFIRNCYKEEEEKAEHTPDRTLYGMGLRIEDHNLLGELDTELKRQNSVLPPHLRGHLRPHHQEEAESHLSRNQYL